MSAGVNERRLLRRLRVRIRRTLRTARYGQPSPPKPGAPPRVAGVVEQFTEKRVAGWVSVPADAAPVPVELRVGTLTVAVTHADRAAADHEPQRNDWQQIRPFAFRLRELWDYTPRGAKLSVRANGYPLPIAGRGMYLRCRQAGALGLDVLRARFADGYVFSDYGRLQLSKKLDLDWQRRVMDLYDKVRTILSEAHGYDAFLIYGSLLGAVREGGPIAHDIDLDVAFISKHTDGRAAAEEMQQVALSLIGRGLDAEPRITAIHVHDQDDPAIRVDLFHLYFDADGRICFPFGVAGSSKFTRDDWDGTQEIQFLGRRVCVPVRPERLVEHIYGPGWREPKPGFDWAKERRYRADEADVTPEMSILTHWANFYTHADTADASTFAALIAGRPDTPRFIVDIGCGDGRDAVYFAGGGRTVIGVDASDVAVRRAAERASAAALGGSASFRMADVACAEALRTILTGAVTKAAAEPVMFYLRFFLHAITDEAQDLLLGVIDEVARPGDVFAAEFRTVDDRTRPKHERPHYRRFIDGPAFGALLTEKYGFDVLHEEEGTGLSPYHDEDPQLYRVIARRAVSGRPGPAHARGPGLQRSASTRRSGSSLRVKSNSQPP